MAIPHISLHHNTLQCVALQHITYTYHYNTSHMTAFRHPSSTYNKQSAWPHMALPYIAWGRATVHYILLHGITTTGVALPRSISPPHKTPSVMARCSVLQGHNNLQGGTTSYSMPLCGGYVDTHRVAMHYETVHLLTVRYAHRVCTQFTPTIHAFQCIDLQRMGFGS